MQKFIIRKFSDNLFSKLTHTNLIIDSLLIFNEENRVEVLFSEVFMFIFGLIVTLLDANTVIYVQNIVS